MTVSRSGWPRWARRLTSPWLVSPVLVIGLLLAAIVGYGAYTRAQPTHYSRGGTFGAAQPAPTPGVSAPATAVGSVASPTAAPTATPSATGSIIAAAGATTGSTTSGGRTSAGTSGATTPAPTTPRVGSYGLEVSGSEHVRFGPFSACTNTFPAQSSLVVSHASGEPGASYDFDQRFYPSSPNQHDERHIYRYEPRAVLLTYEEATVTCAGVKQSTTVDYTPAQERVQLPLRVGAQWHSRGGDSNRTEDATASITGTDHLTIGGHSYLTYVVNVHVTMSGSESGSRDQRWWWSPALALPVKWHESLRGSRSGASYSEDVTCTVTSVPTA